MAILVVEDDAFYANRLIEILSDYGEEATLAKTIQEATQLDVEKFGAAIIDVMLPNDPDISGISDTETHAGFIAGVALARRLRKQNPTLRIILITGDVWSSEAEQWATANDVPIVKKYDARGSVFAELRRAGLLAEASPPKAFIVHGHDESALLDLKNYLQNTLRWQEPLVLREQPSCGKTLIEKFEEYSGHIDCVFVLLTPDDANLSGPLKESRRSRQNVIFELGFFFGQLGRESGRIIVLYKGPNELPSDIHGIVWIGIDAGVEAAGEQIRREVARLAASPARERIRF